MPRASGMPFAHDPGMKNDKTPRNQEGQPPTQTPDETEDRLEEKEQQDRGQANKDRIEAKISQLKD